MPVFKTAGVQRPEQHTLPYLIVAERGSETIRSTRASALIAVAKAKIFIEEGWKTHITDEHGRNFEPAEFHLLPAVRPTIVKAIDDAKVAGGPAMLPVALNAGQSNDPAT